MHTAGGFPVLIRAFHLTLTVEAKCILFVSFHFISWRDINNMCYTYIELKFFKTHIIYFNISV